ncbi:MAG: TIGR03936 family radical SAM-associated protein [Oscillospiraceae bacterium]|jgi:radical SAM-linked protein|nr:TIGR03936 family radical SAM-associated protein [Oscillospiraceae bacterium]
MSKYRLKFEKLGRAVWISHLDTMETWRRAFRRADVTLRHSEGFNPHPLMSIALPLSVGQESVCELLDFDTTHPIERAETVRRLNDALPEGFRALDITIAAKKCALIKWVAVEGVLDYAELPDVPTLTEPFRGAALPIVKKTKRGETTLDLIACTRRVKCSTDGVTVTLRALVSAQEPTVNPALLLDALTVKPLSAKFRRVELYDANENVFE